jgi:hypothetical protein
MADLQTMCSNSRSKNPDTCFNRYGNKACRQKFIFLPREVSLTSVADPDPNPDPDPPDPHVLGLLDPDPLVRDMDPDLSIIKQLEKP